MHQHYAVYRVCLSMAVFMAAIASITATAAAAAVTTTSVEPLPLPQPTYLFYCRLS